MQSPLLALLLVALSAQAQSPITTYALGEDDQISITVLDLDEVSTKAPIRIDSRGDITLPIVGRIHAAGRTPEQVELEIEEKLSKVLQTPDVTVSLIEMRSQPISVLGAVATPGVQQLQGRKSLFEVISMAGGIRPDAGHRIKVTRRLQWGKLPLPDAADDPTGRFSIGSVSVKSVMDAANPVENIEIKPQDVITVPKGELIYAVGALRKTGGFMLGENESLSALKVLSLAEGFERFADSKKAKIIRTGPAPDVRTEIALDLQAMLAGKTTDVPLLPNDILFVPISKRRAATIRGVETALGMGTSIGTGMVIYRR